MNYKKIFKYDDLIRNQLKINLLSVEIERSYIVSYELKSIYRNNLKKLKNINSYRGLRHTLMLPTRGQRTHSNASTLRKVLLLKRKRRLMKYDFKKNS